MIETGRRACQRRAFRRGAAAARLQQGVRPACAPPDGPATRLKELTAGGRVTVLLARSEENRLAQRLYETAGSRRTEGEGVIT